MKNQLLAIILLLTCFNWGQLFGQVNFAAKQVIMDSVQGGQGPRATGLADLDGDGDLDAYATFVGGNLTGWYENMGGGEFSIVKKLTRGTNIPGEIKHADLDADGDLDVVIRGASPGLAWYENDGTGSFSLGQVLVSTIVSFRHTRIADFDGDGDPDIFSYQFPAGNGWYVNDGSGNFSSYVGLGIIGVNEEYDIGDLDGDGDVDFAYADDFDREINWFENLGDSSFAPAVLLASSESFTDLEIKDVDGDGIDDLISGFPGSVSIIYGLGGGVFSPLQTISVGSVRKIHAADFDGDSLVDICYSGSSYELTWVKNLGGGTFGSGQALPEKLANADEITSGDIDGDGDAELFGVEGITNTMGYFPFEAGGYNSFKHLNFTIEDLRQVVIGDVDGDGIDDVLSGSDDDRIAWYKNDGNGNFGQQQVISNLVQSPRMLKVADLDNDGDLDAISVKTGSNDEILYYENTGDGVFEEPQFINTTLRPIRELFIYDMDADGLLDILAYDDDVLLLYLNLGGGSFASGTGVIGGSSLEIAIADVDGDSMLDAVAGTAGVGSSPAGIIWRKNLGGGSFTSSQYINSIYGGGDITLLDLELDGDVDILEMNFSSTIKLENLGGGSFGARTPISTLIYDFNIQQGDLDNDGDMDLIGSSRFTDSAFHWYENLGNGEFGPRNFIESNIYRPMQIAIGDLNGDGLQDVVGALDDPSQIVWYQSLPTAACQPPVGLTHSLPDLTELNLSWDSVPGALAYQIRIIRNTGSFKKKWFRSESSLLNLTSFTFTEGDNYSWSVRTACSTDTSAWALPGNIIIPLSEEISLGKISTPEVSISPNPVSDLLSINFTADKQYAVKIYSADGKIHYSETTSAQGFVSEKIDLSALDAGLLLIELTIDGRRITKAILKE